MSRAPRWTDKDVAKLQELIAEGGEYGRRGSQRSVEWWTHIAETHFPGRTVNAVRWKAWDLNANPQECTSFIEEEPEPSVLSTPGRLRWTRWTEEEKARLWELADGNEHMPTDWWEELAKNHFPNRTAAAVRYKCWERRHKREQEAASLQNESISQATRQGATNDTTNQQEPSGGERVRDPRVLDYLARDETVSEEDAEPDAMEVDKNVPTRNAGIRRGRRGRPPKRIYKRYSRRARRAVSRYAPPFATFNLRQNRADDDQERADPETESLLQKIRQRVVDERRSRATLAEELERVRRANPLGHSGGITHLVEVEKSLREACNDFKSKSEKCMARMNWEDESIQSSIRAMEAQLNALAQLVRPYDNASQQ